MAAEIAGGLSDKGWCVVSGGAYGIDAAAHRAALTGATPTVAVMAGGVDRLYPAGHTDLLGAVLETGVVFSEVPVGFAPHRSRFLARNRLIAAAATTCVVEAAMRSGALNTVNHALEWGRVVGAVPGPVTSVSSQGCHRLIRDGLAILVTDASHVIELAGPIGPDDEVTVGEGFGGPGERAAFDAIAARGSRVEDIARGAGLGIGEAIAALAGLELEGKASQVGGVWRRTKTSTN
jgi:DNA processing protein